MAKVGHLTRRRPLAFGGVPIGDFSGGCCGYFAFLWKFCHLMPPTKAAALLAKRSSWCTHRCVNDANARSKLRVGLRLHLRPPKPKGHPTHPTFLPTCLRFRVHFVRQLFFAQYSANAPLDFKLSPDALWPPPELSTQPDPTRLDATRFSISIYFAVPRPLGCLLICCLRQLLSKSG